ncbi:MAG TPA: LytTR family DNA-binding domain-containing protein [Opitutaceae bacterium]|nr:LytTR family DNA-binding domain-containing protein [Opitutaceae bacterium]
MNLPWRAFLVDDEMPALKRLGRLLESSGRVKVIGSTTNPAKAIEAMVGDPPDILFLDIEMPEIDGFELLRRLSCHPVVIFTTAYNQYALKAFEVNSIDYLLKPVEPDLLERALNKLERFRGATRPKWLEQPDVQNILQELSRSMRDLQAGPLKRIPIRVDERIKFLDLARVTHFFARDRLTYATADNKTYCIDWTIAELEERFGGTKFVRIHRSALLNLDWLDEVIPWFTGRLVVRLKDEKRTELIVARDRVRALKERLNL